MSSFQTIAPDTQLNWLARYVPIREHLTETALSSLLEVGSGSRGLSCLLPSNPSGSGGVSFVGIDMKFAGPPAASMVPFTYDGGKLPFKNGAFHTVVSMDTLEHVPPAGRPGFLEELLRVSSARVIVGFPSRAEGERDTGARGLEGERFLQVLFRALGMGDPVWLREHEELGLPSAAEVEALLVRYEGWSVRPLKTIGNLVSLMAVLMDVLPGAGSWVAPVLGGHASELEAWFRAGMFGPTDRAAFLLERHQPAAPLVSWSVRPARQQVIAGGLSCPDCDGNLEESSPPAPEAAICVGCRRIFPRDALGIIPLCASPGPVTFRLSPDWLGTLDWVAPLHNYLHAFPSGLDCRLWLDVDPATISLAEVVELVGPVLAPFGDKPFAEIYLNDDPADRPRGGRVITLPAGDRTAGASPAWFRAQAPSVGGADVR